MPDLPGWNPDNQIRFRIDETKVGSDQNNLAVRVNLDDPGSAGLDWTPVFTELNEYNPAIIENSPAANAISTSIAFVGSTVFILYRDASANELRLAKSTDNGNDGTWVTSFIAGPASNIGLFQAIHAVDADNIYIAFKYFTNNTIYFNSSSNGGSSWGPGSAVDTDVYSNVEIGIGVGATKVYVAYNKDDDFKIASRLLSGGSWTVYDVSSERSGGIAIHVVDDDNLAASYGIDGATDSTSVVRMVGGVWKSPQNIASGVNHTGIDTSIVATDMDNIYVSYSKSGYTDLWFAKTSNGSQTNPTWTVTELQNGITVGDTSIGIAGSNIYIAYGDQTSRDLRLATSDNLGEVGSWSYSQLDTSGTYDIGDTAIAVTGVGLYGVIYARQGLQFYSETIVVTDSHNKQIAITTSDGVTQCDVEIEYWDGDNQNATLWFRAPFVSSTEWTSFKLYYDINHADNSTYVGDIGETPAQNVWNSNYLGVYHFQELPTGSSGDIKDSTSNLNNLTSVNMDSSNSVSGFIGKSLEFNGTTQYLQIASAITADLDFSTTPFTLEAIIQSDDGSDNSVGAVIDKVGPTYPTGYGMWIRGDNSDELQMYTEEDADTNGTPENIRTIANYSDNYANDTRYNIVGVYKDNNTPDPYVGGVSVSKSDTTAGSVPDVSNAGLFNIGRYSRTNTHHFKGIIHSVRVLNGARSEEWAETNNHIYEDTLLLPGPTYNITVSTNTGGSIDPSGVIVVPEFGEQSFSVTVDPGFYLYSISVNDVLIPNEENFTISNISDDISLVVSFGAISIGGSWIFGRFTHEG